MHEEEGNSIRRRLCRVNMRNRCRALLFWLVSIKFFCCSKTSSATCFPAIFYFGDNDGDTGGIKASFPNTTAAEFAPYGETYFGNPTGRNSDGRLIVDFIAEAYGLRFLDPYLQSVTSDFAHGVSFATWGAVAQTVNFLSAFPLGTQVLQFQLFQKEVLDILNQTSGVVASSLGNMSALQQLEDARSGVHIYKKLYDDLYGSLTTNTTANESVDPLQTALLNAKRIPLSTYFTDGLYMISIGTNDFKFGLVNGQTTDQIAQSFPTIVTNITTAVQGLYTAGARNIIVSGVGTLGCSPSILTVVAYAPTDLDSWGCLADFNTIARSYNTLLYQGLVAVLPQVPSATVTFLDLYQIQHNLLFNYTMNGFVDPMVACCGVPSKYNYNQMVLCGEKATIANVQILSIACTDPSTYADWDGVHFTDAANKYFASQIFSGQFFSPPFTMIGNNCTTEIVL